VFLTLWVDRRERTRTPAVKSDATIGRKGGFQLVLPSRYLFLIAMLVVVLNIVNTIGEFILGKLVVAHAAAAIASGAAGGLSEGAIIGEFYGTFFFWVNLVGFLSSCFWSRGSSAPACARLFILPASPCSATACSPRCPCSPSCGWRRFSRTAPTIRSTTPPATLFLPTSREANNAQQAIDSFFSRAGDLLQAVVVFAGAQLAFGVRGYAIVNIALVVVWLALVVGITRAHKKLTADDSAEKAA
jgi:AAA family ATP:ADP antiporter